MAAGAYEIEERVVVFRTNRDGEVLVGIGQVIEQCCVLPKVVLGEIRRRRREVPRIEDAWMVMDEVSAVHKKYAQTF